MVRINRIDAMAKGDLIIQLSYTKSPKKILEYFKLKGYKWDDKPPSLGKIKAYIQEKRFSEPQFLRSESFVVLVHIADEPRPFPANGSDALSVFKKHVNNHGPNNVQLLKVIDYKMDILFGDYGKEPEDGEEPDGEKQDDEPAEPQR